MSRVPKHRELFDLLHREISSGKYARTGRLPSEMQLVRRFNLSRPTVARALMELQKMGLLERRVGSGTYLRATPPTTTRLLGLLVPGLGKTEILDPVCREISRVAEQNGFAMLWGNPFSDGSSSADAEAICEQYIERKVAGVFFAPLELPEDRETVNQRLVARLTEAGITVVLLDRDLESFPYRSDLDLIGVDNFSAGFVLARHLLHIGCRRLAFVTRPQYPSTTDQRLAGCREALRRAPTPGHSDQIRVLVGDPADPGFAGQLLAGPHHADAVICSNDLTAAMLIRTLSDQDVKVPDDLRVAGFDDVDYATLLPAPLTTMRLPCQDIGKAATRAMIERLAEPHLPGRQILLHAKLIIRQSCGGKTPV